MKKAIIISAPSGSGKTSIVRHLLEQNLNLMFSISCTTRKKRKNEINGKDYYFIENEIFKQKIINDKFLEWEEVYENIYYGTLKSEIKRIWNLKKIVIFDIDVEGGIKIKNKFKNKALSIFIKSPSILEIKKRLSLRNTESEKDLNIRIQKIRKEIKKENKFDCSVVNDDLKKTCLEIIKKIKLFIDE
tara:strand:+ start:3226 stop:3789 length:564 start_codon:yes stop_codon:yes gene_type:complete